MRAGLFVMHVVVWRGVRVGLGVVVYQVFHSVGDLA